MEINKNVRRENRVPYYASFENLVYIGFFRAHSRRFSVLLTSNATKSIIYGYTIIGN